MDINTRSKRRTERYLTVLKVILSAAILFWLLKSGRIDLGLLKNLSGNNLSYILVVLLLNFFQGLVVATRWFLLHKVRGMKVRWLECVRLNFLGNFFNVCLPGNAGGELYKSYYIAQYFPGKRVEAATIVFFSLFLGLFALGLMAFIAMLLKILPSNIPSLSSVSIVTGITFLILVFGFLFTFSTKVHSSSYLNKLFEKIPFGFWIKRIYDEVYSFREHKITLVNTIILSFFAHSLQIFGFFLVGRMLNDKLGVGLYFFVTPIILFCNLLPITPGGLGVGESVSSFLLDASGSPLGANIMLFFRCTVIVLAIITGVPAYFIRQKPTMAVRSL